MKNTTHEHDTVFALSVRAGDILVAVLSGWLAYLSYLDASHVWTLFYSYAFFLVVLLVIVIFSYLSLYQVWRGASFAVEAKKIILAWGLVFSIFTIFAFLSKTGASYSRFWLGLWFVFGLFGLLGFRVCVRAALRYSRRKGINLRRIVIVGSTKMAHEIAIQVEHAHWAGVSIAGFFSIEEPSIVEDQDHIPMLGQRKAVSDYLLKNNIDQVWIAVPVSEGAMLESVLYDLRHETVNIRYVPDLLGMRLINHSVAEVAGIPMVNLSVTPMEGANRWIKAIEDRCLAALILLLILPLLLAIAIGIKLTSKGPVIYRQTRIGWNGRPFTIFKFRTMPTDVEKSGVEWGQSIQKTKSKLGAFLRSSSLDELPQFFNVLRGDMSVVGPRPERPVFVEEFKESVPEYMKKHMVKAGITGWAQVHGWRGDTDLAKRIEFDLYYIENWSLWFDIEIIFMTVFTGFRHRNAS